MIRILATAVTALAMTLAACRASRPPDAIAPPAAVSAVLPSRHTFHDTIAAFGQLTTDNRNVLALDLPQAGAIRAIEVRPGERVRAHQPLLRLTTDPATRNAYLIARSAQHFAQSDLTNTRQMHAAGLATTSQLDAARKALEDASTTLAAITAAGGATAEVTLRAPAAGVVTRINVQRGQRVPAGTTLLTLMPTSVLIAQLGMNPELANRVRVGMPVTLHPVFAAPGAPPLHGRITMLGATVDAESHLLPITATLDATPDLPLGSALSARVVGAPLMAWSVPRAALRSDAAGDFVYQIERGVAQRVAVKITAADGDPVGVDGALDPKAPVIVLGSDEVSAGAAVTATRAESVVR